MPADSKRGCLGGVLVLGAIAAIIYFVEPPKAPSIFTPGVMPDPAGDSEREIIGPNFTNIVGARAWAVAEAYKHGPAATWIIYRDLIWNDKYRMPVAKEKLR